MAAPPQTFYLNADFDLSLRPRPRQASHAILDRQVRELSALSLLGATSRDSALLRLPVPDPFIDYLIQAGVPVPRQLDYPAIAPETRWAPFGWNAEAAQLNRQHESPTPHPPLDSVRRVNSRSFALELERDLPDPAARDTAQSCLITSIEELEAFLDSSASDAHWMLKSEHGNAGLANRTLRSPVLTPADRRFVETRLAEDDRILVEPFRRRVHDWAMIFSVPFKTETFRHHETFYTQGGGMIGALFTSKDEAPGICREFLLETAQAIAERLETESYVGPVCVDGFSFGDSQSPILRPLADLNCREALSNGAARLRLQLAPDKALLYRSFAWNKLQLPGELKEIVDALGDAAYDPGTRTGILLGSPPRFEAGGPKPLRLTVLMFADDRASALELERRFRERFEPAR